MDKTNSSSPSLIRGLGLWAATAVVVGSMIGQSIFLVPGDVARQASSPFHALTLWIAGGIVILFGAFCYAELGAALPEAGGDYVYQARGLTRTCGFLYGWTSAMILKPGSAAIIAAGFSRLATFLRPSLAFPILAWQIKIQLSEAQLLAVATVMIATLVNYFGIRTAGRFQIVLTVSKVVAVAAIVAFGIALGRPGGGGLAMPPTPVSYGISAVLTALVPVMMAYNGFGILGNVGGEIINPHKNLPRAAILGSALVVGLYALANWTYFRILGFSQVVQSEHVASDVLAALIGSKAAMLMTVAMMVSAFGSLHANLLVSPRVPYAMARDGAFFSLARRIQPAFHTPSGGLIFEGSAAVLFVLTGTYQEIYSVVMFAHWTFYALTAAALFGLRSREPGLLRPYRAWGYPWTPLIFMVVASAISVNLWWVRPVRSSIGLGIILVGLPFLYHWRRQATSVAVMCEEPVNVDYTIRGTGQTSDLRNSSWRVGKQ
jgi:APA family basic amino acid/polyamine antiporter